MVLAIAAACAILMVGRIFADAVDYLVSVQFGLAQHEDLTVAFTEPTAVAAAFALFRSPGVRAGEAFRAVPVVLTYEQRRYRTTMQGLPAEARLHRLLDDRLMVLSPPENGLALTDELGRWLGVRPGDLLEVEVLEGRRPQLQLRVAALSREYVGVGAYMELKALNRVLGEGRGDFRVHLQVDPARGA